MNIKICFSLGIFLSLLIWVVQGQGVEDPFIREKDYKNGQPTYESYKRTSTFVDMSDGVKLAVDILEPRQGPFKEKSPVVFIFTPYGRSYLVPDVGFFGRLAGAIAGVGWGPDVDMGDYNPSVELLLRQGYRVVVADMRGTGASFGYQMPLEPRLARDGKEIVEWIADQNWCDGNIGMIGASFLAWAQFVTAAQKPEALKCIVPEVMGFDVYSTGVRPGGIPLERWIDGFSYRLRGYNLNVKEISKGLFPTLPVIDEDHDGDLEDEWPHINREEIGKGYFFPTYSDGKRREQSLYYAAILDHLDNVQGEEFLDSSFQYYDSYGPPPFDTVSYKVTSPGYYARDIAESGVAVYNIGGWYDGFVKGTPMWQATLAETNPSHMMIAPRFHIPIIPKYYRKFSGYKGNYPEQLAMEQLRFLDYHLKGLQNGWEKDSAVKIFIVHEGWYLANQWPLPNSNYKSYFFQSDGSLSHQLRKKGRLSYEVDFTVSSNYGKNKRNRWLMYLPGTGEVMNRKEVDDKTLLLESSPLSKDFIVAGHPLVSVYLSNDRPYGDLFVYLEEVDDKGNAYYVTEGQLRGGWAQTRDYDVVADHRIKVKPDLMPWKGFQANQWQDSIFAKNEVVEMSFDLLPIAYKFRKGNRIRISIAGADRGNFQLHPKLCPDGDPRKCLPTTYRIICTDSYPSKIELPILER